MYVSRKIEPLIKQYLFQQKVIIIYGARQVGKTTLVKKILADTGVNGKYINCEEGDIQRQFAQADTSTQLKQIIGNQPLTILDEAQRIDTIGLKLKLLIDTYPEQQIIATGSSSFQLGQTIVEPLTGRSREFWLYPLSLSEIAAHTSERELGRELEALLRFGMYPDVYIAPSIEEKQTIISAIAANYLYKDVLQFHNLKGEQTIKKLLEALALQVGNEVSLTELSALLGIHKQTVSSYIDILEQAFIIFTLRPLHRNRRKELGKLRKIYFYDTGIRNAVIQNQNPLSLRNDVGALWENCIVAERKKLNYSMGKQSNLFFWRTYDQQEVDLVEETAGIMTGYEIKWQQLRKTPPKAWQELYPTARWQPITRDTYETML